ncbi:MAG: PilN domain-containing protein [Candidatus Acidiferrales bacterium]
MIRINLLPQPRPKARRVASAGPASSSFQAVVLLIGALAGLGLLAALYMFNASALTRKQEEVRRLTQRKQELERIKLEVEGFQRQKAMLDQRIAVIQDLQRNKVGGQELLDAVANTVVRTETLWLTTMDRKGNALTFEGTAASLTAVANFITQLRRSGYFGNVEIKESKQDDRNKDVQTFNFILSAEFALPATQQQQQQPPQQAPSGRPPAGKTT